MIAIEAVKAYSLWLIACGLNIVCYLMLVICNLF
jgi:hypothetical protein